MTLTTEQIIEVHEAAADIVKNQLNFEDWKQIVESGLPEIRKEEIRNWQMWGEIPWHENSEEMCEALFSGIEECALLMYEAHD